MTLLLFAITLAVFGKSAAPLSSVPPEEEYLQFVRQEAAKRRENETPPATLEAWERHNSALRKRLFKAW